jgi:hypothetical protein
MRWLVIAIFLSSLFVLQPNSRLMYADDDDDYFAVSTSIAFGQFPSFANEYHVGERMPFASVGPGVLAAPFVALFSVIDRVNHAPIVAKRTKDNRYWTWSLLGFQFAAYTYALLGLLALNGALRRWASRDAADIATFLSVFAGGGLLIFVFNRPVMSHAFEFFTVSVMTWLLTLQMKGQRLVCFYEMVGATAALLFLCRYNNAFLALSFLVIAFISGLESKSAPSRGQLIRSILLFFGLIALFRLAPVAVNGYSAYDQSYASVQDRLIPALSPLFYWNRIGEIVLAADMGLLYTAPAFLIGIYALWAYRGRLPGALKFLSLVALANVYLTVVWKTFGAFYGYRYICFTAMPLVAVPLAMMLEDVSASIGRYRLWLVSIGLAAFPFASVSVFGKLGKYNLAPLVNQYGIQTYSQPTYHKDLLSDLFMNFEQTIVEVIKQSAFSSLWSGMPLSEVLQRVCLYLGPPTLVLLLLWGARRVCSGEGGSMRPTLHHGGMDTP